MKSVALFLAIQLPQNQCTLFPHALGESNLTTNTEEIAPSLNINASIVTPYLEEYPTPLTYPFHPTPSLHSPLTTLSPLHNPQARLNNPYSSILCTDLQCIEIPNYMPALTLVNHDTPCPTGNKLFMTSLHDKNLCLSNPNTHSLYLPTPKVLHLFPKGSIPFAKEHQRLILDGVPYSIGEKLPSSQKSNLRGFKALPVTLSYLTEATEDGESSEVEKDSSSDLPFSSSSSDYVSSSESPQGGLKQRLEDESKNSPLPIRREHSAPLPSREHPLTFSSTSSNEKNTFKAQKLHSLQFSECKSAGMNAEDCFPLLSPPERNSLPSSNHSSEEYSETEVESESESSGRFLWYPKEAKIKKITTPSRPQPLSCKPFEGCGLEEDITNKSPFTITDEVVTEEEESQKEIMRQEWIKKRDQSLLAKQRENMIIYQAILKGKNQGKDSGEKEWYMVSNEEEEALLRATSHPPIEEVEEEDKSPKESSLSDGMNNSPCLLPREVLNCINQD